VSLGAENDVRQIALGPRNGMAIDGRLAPY